MPRGGPQFEFGVTGRLQFQERIVVPILQREPRHDLGMTAIEGLGEPEHRGQLADNAPALLRQVRVPLVAAQRHRAPVIPRDERYGFDVLRFEAAKIAVANQVVRVLVMAFVADVHADVVQEGRILEPFALPVGQRVRATRGVEQGEREPRDVLRVLGCVVAPFGKLDDAAPPHVGVAHRASDLLAVASDVVEDDALAKRHVAERDLARAEPSEDHVDQDRTRDRDVRAPGVEPRKQEPLLK